MFAKNVIKNGRFANKAKGVARVKSDEQVIASVKYPADKPPEVNEDTNPSEINAIKLRQRLLPAIEHYNSWIAKGTCPFNTFEEYFMCGAERLWKHICTYEKERTTMVLKAGTTVFSIKYGATKRGIPIYVIEDHDEGMSVTNNAKSVVEEVCLELGAIPDNSVVVYRDTLGEWDGLNVVGGEFVGFLPFGAATESEAISMAVARRPDHNPGF